MYACDIQKCMDAIEPEWTLYRTFLQVASDGNLSTAARKLGLTQPTASRHIKALESKLATALFTRERQGLLPTPVARAMIPHAGAMAAAAAALRLSCSAEQQDDRGAVRVTAGQLVSQQILPPILAEFCHQHPKIEVELAVSDRNEDLLQREADVAVRMLQPTQQSLIGKRIGFIEVGLFAHRRYAERFGLPRSIADLSSHRLIGFDREPHAIHSAGGAAARLTREQFGFRCDSAPVQVAALQAGVGIGGRHVHLAQHDPDLVRVLEETMTFRCEMWLVMHRDQKTTRRIRMMFDHLSVSLSTRINSQQPPAARSRATFSRGALVSHQSERSAALDRRHVSK